MQGALLEVEFASRVEQLEMHYRVQYLAAVVALSAGGFSYGIAAWVDNRKNFIGIDGHGFYA